MSAERVRDERAEGLQIPHVRPRLQEAVQPERTVRRFWPDWLKGGISLVAENGNGKETGRLQAQWPAAVIIVTLGLALFSNYNSGRDKEVNAAFERGQLMQKLDTLTKTVDDFKKDLENKLEIYKADTSRDLKSFKEYVDSVSYKVNKVEGELNATRR